MASMPDLDRLLFITLIITTAIFACSVNGEVHHHDFILKEKNFSRLCVNKSMLVVNGQFPGPTLHVRKGDTMFVNVHNQGNYGVTLHWHGVNQPRNPWSDGPEYVTQCPIQPGANFTYEVTFSTEEGTLWWHAHSDWTRNTVHGAITIYPALRTTYPYPTPDGEQILILGSWYDFDVNKVVKERLISGEDLPASSAYLINGLPGDLMSISCSHSATTESTFRWTVDRDKTYLLRLINAAMNAELFFQIAQHNLTVVGMDGNYLKPFVTSHIMISPGQTIDALVTTNQSSLHSYYIGVRNFKSLVLETPVYDFSNATAILQYRTGDDDQNAPFPVFPTTLPLYKDYDAAYGFVRKLRSLRDVDVPMNISMRMFITASVNQYHYGENSTIEAAYGSSVNNVSWVNPEIDILQAYYRNISDVYTDDFPNNPPKYFNFTSDALLGSNTTEAARGTKLKVLSYNEQVEMVFQGTNVLSATEDHPMHLHGHNFYLVGFGEGIFDPLLDPLRYNLVDPPFLNTATTPRNGWATVRFTANNPGVWFWHCHLDRHMLWGMDSVFIVKNGGTANSTMRDPPPNMPYCKPSSLPLRRQSSNSFPKTI